MLITFPVFKGRAKCKFDCPSCGATRRTRIFTVENTVNPYNRDERGTPKSSTVVWREAQIAAELERDQFLTEPLCRGCEDALPYRTRAEIGERRRSALSRPHGGGQ